MPHWLHRAHSPSSPPPSPKVQQRVRAIGLYTTVSAAGGATGLVAGGLLTELVSWRWVMFVNVPIGLAVWLWVASSLARPSVKHGHFDLVGALTCTIGVTGVVLGLVEAGSKGWTSPVSLVALVGGVVVLAYFLHHESRVEEPILPLRLLAHATRNSANVARALLYAGFYGLFYFMAQFLQDVQGYSPLRAGASRSFLCRRRSSWLAAHQSGLASPPAREGGHDHSGTPSPSSGSCWPPASGPARPTPRSRSASC